MLTSQSKIIFNIKHLNKGWTHILFDDLQAEEFIEKIMGSFS